MNRKIVILIGAILAAIGIGAAALISSYDSVTGYATVKQSIEFDIMGSSNDDNYTLNDVHQGEIVYSPKIKLKNHADVPIQVNLTTEILPGSVGNENDVKLSLVDENKTQTLENPVTVPTTDMYFYVKHEFSPSANTGNYSFLTTAIPS